MIKITLLSDYCHLSAEEGRIILRHIFLDFSVHHIMKIILLLIFISLVVALGFLGAFLWAVRSGQYEDEYTPSVRMLLDDDAPSTSKNDNPANSKK
jgi:cbb3-type cytochrome oxidase maturation protein